MATNESVNFKMGADRKRMLIQLRFDRPIEVIIFDRDGASDLLNILREKLDDIGGPVVRPIKSPLAGIPHGAGIIVPPIPVPPRPSRPRKR